MDYKDLFKKYWFVGLVGILLIAFIGVYAADLYKNHEVVVESKVVDDKYVAYSVDDVNVFADDFFNSLYDKDGLKTVYLLLQRKVLNSAYETTDDMSTMAANYAAYMYQNYGEAYVVRQLQQMGYVNGVNDLQQYYIDAQKQELLLNDYIANNYDKIAPAFVEETNPMAVKHILIKVADITQSTAEDGSTVLTANPTEEEKAKLDAVLEALKTEDFDAVQAQYNEDGTNDAYIICSLNESTYDANFLAAAQELDVNEISDVVVSTYGYHIIKNLGNSKDALLSTYQLAEQLESYDSALSLKAVKDKADELGYKIVDDELRNLIETEIGSEDAQ